MEKVTLNYQVAVVGAGPGGFSVAITAARKGLKTIMIERNSFIGGNAAAGIPFLGFFDKHHRRLVKGFGEEVVNRFVEEGISDGHRYCPKHQSIVCFEPDRAKNIYANMCKEAGVDVILHAEMIDACAVDGKVQYIEVAARSKRFEICADIFVDSADGDISYFCGAEYEKGNEKGEMQPPSILFTVDNVDDERFFKYLEDNPSEQGCYKMEYLRHARNFSYVGLRTLYKELREKGEWPMEIWAAIIISSPNSREYFINGPRMGGTDATDPLSITNAELLGQEQAHKFMKVLKDHIPGFENAHISTINANSICIREEKGEGNKQLTADDVIKGLYLMIPLRLAVINRHPRK
ncbi:MAG: FAD-dependent oxidoreductase [Lachnospiraceae bacterium]